MRKKGQSANFKKGSEMKDRVKANSHLRKALSIMQNAMMSHSIEFMPNEDISEALDKAIIECQKCIELSPEHAEAYATLGAMYWDKDEMDKSIESYTKAIEWPATTTFTSQRQLHLPIN